MIPTAWTQYMYRFDVYKWALSKTNFEPKQAWLMQVFWFQFAYNVKLGPSLGKEVEPPRSSGACKGQISGGLCTVYPWG